MRLAFRMMKNDLRGRFGQGFYFDPWVRYDSTHLQTGVMSSDPRDDNLSQAGSFYREYFILMRLILIVDDCSNRSSFLGYKFF